MKGIVFVVSAPSGAGKTSLLREVFQKFPQMVFSVSVTTRNPRPNETNGKDYRFCSREEFNKMIEHNDLAEWQEVHGNLYGTPIAPVRETIAQGKNMVLDIDVYGKVKFDRIFSENIGILILPPSFQELERRLRGRGTESEEVIGRRLANARKEMDFAQKEGRYEYRVVNDRFADALAELTRIIKKEGRG